MLIKKYLYTFVFNPLARTVFLLERLLMKITAELLPHRFKKGFSYFCARIALPKLKETHVMKPYSKRIKVCFCFDDNLWHQAAVVILSLLKNSPACQYDIYCISTAEKEHITFIQKIVKKHGLGSKMTLLHPNNDFNESYLGKWPAAIYWRCMLPKLLPNTDKIIYADVDTLFLSDLRYADMIDLQNNLIGGVFDKNDYINSGFMIMNLAEFRKNGIYEKMINLSGKIQSDYPDQDVLNKIAFGRIVNISRKFNLSLHQTQKMLRTMTLLEYCELKHPVMLHYSTDVKPWKQEFNFYGFNLWYKYANEIQDA